MIDIAFHPLFPLDMGPLHYFSVLGRALFTAQHLEMNCRAFAFYVQLREQEYLHGSSVLEDPKFLKLWDRFWQKTLGQNVHKLNEIGIFPEDAVPVFRAAVQARNEIAHDVAMDLTDRLDFELKERIDHILDLVRTIAKADKMFSTIIHVLNEGSLPTRNFLESYEDKVVAWVSEDTFED